MADSEDRRVLRTRDALLKAFRELVFKQGYRATTIRQVVDRANVGRSTFYEHFSGKEDILRASMGQFFVKFADALIEEQPSPRLKSALDHLLSNRRLTDQIFTGPARLILGRDLARMIEERLEGTSRGRETKVPVRLVAIHLAEAQLSLTEAWLRGKAHCSSSALADGIRASGRASASSLLFGAPSEACG